MLGGIEVWNQKWFHEAENPKLGSKMIKEPEPEEAQRPRQRVQKPRKGPKRPRSLEKAQKRPRSLEKAQKRPRRPEKARRGQKRLGRGKKGCSVGLRFRVDP